MKKLLLLFLMTLLSATAVEAAQFYLRFWGNGTFSSPNYCMKNDNKDVPSSGSNTWTYTVQGSQFDTWGTVNSTTGNVYFVVYINQDGEGWAGPSSYSEYTSSGQTFNLNRSNGTGNCCGIKLPNDYANKTFTFLLSNNSGGSIDITVTWDVDLRLKSTVAGNLDSGDGTAFSSYNNGEYIWTWTKSQLSNYQNNDKLYFYLYNNDDQTVQGAYESDVDMTNFTTDNGWYGCNGTNRFWVDYKEGYTYTIRAKYEDSKWKIKIDQNIPIQIKSTIDLWHGADYESESNGEYTWTWTKSQLSGITDGSTLEFYLTVAGTDYGPWNADYTWGSTPSSEGTTVHVKASSAPNLYAYTYSNGDSPINGDWPGTTMSTDTEYDSDGNYVKHFTQGDIKIILKGDNNNDGNHQTSSAGIVCSGDVFYIYDLNTTATKCGYMDNSWYTNCLEGSTHKFLIEYNKGETYTIKAKKNGDLWSVQVIINEIDHDYYWVSPQVTNNQKWEYFKMVPSRNRSGSHGDGKISDKYFSFTIKDNDLKNWDGTALNEGDDIKWYVVRDDEKKWFRPESDVDNGSKVGTKPKPDDTHEADFYSYNYMDCGTTTARTGHFIFEKGTNVSYTFVLNAKPSSGSGNLFVNSPEHKASTDGSGTEYYLIGNFNGVDKIEDISVTNTDHPMTKLWYVGSTKYTSDPGEPCDSIVYECSVSKPDGGWGNLYLDINPAGITDWSNENELGSQYRPLISLGNELDGRALVGGLTRYNSNQSLNPQPSEFYTGYTFRFNATTMTYHLEFHTSLYLVGTAVRADGKGGTWDLTDPDALIPLKSTQEDRHFRNTVTFTNGAKSGTDYGKGFRFLIKEDENNSPTYAENWGENGNEPRFTSLGVNDPHYADKDTQYRNYLQYNEGNSSNVAPTADGSKDIIFDLPNGTYVINFYDFGDKSYYTIERESELRDFNDVVYKNTKRRILGRGETSTTNNGTTTYDFTNAYKFFRVWSDYIAWYKPDDVDVFVVSDFTPSGNHAATVTLTKQDATYIPANTGVILAMKTDKNSLKGGMRYAQIPDAQLPTNTAYNNAWMQMTPYVEPGENTITLPTGKTSLLLPLYESKTLDRYETSNNNEYANYLFGFYRANKVVANYSGDNEDFLLGFWQTTGAGSTYANSAFLQITRALADQLGVGASYTVSENGQNAPAFMLSFEDPIDPTVTGIVDVDKDVTSPTYKAVNDNWYTIEGVRISAPTTKGIYIHGGKKVIVR